MKTLKDYEQDLNKCSKCGLCEAVCPIFKINPNDCAASKGKFIMLHGVVRGELKFSKNLNRYMDMCLKCGKCKAFCPSGIDVCEIISVAKSEYSKNTFYGKVFRFATQWKIFRALIKTGGILSSIFRKKIKSQNVPSLRVLYFKGCVNKIFPGTDRSLAKIFKNSPVEFFEKDFDCCGLPFLSEGSLERFEQSAKYNTSLLTGDYDYIVTDCASCESTIMDYPKYISENNFPPPEKFINIGDLIVKSNLKFRFKKSLNVTFHKPCHLKDDKFFEEIIKNCDNINYIKMKNYDDCCGFAGSFGIKNRSMSRELSKNKAQSILNTGADYVITTCPSCIIGLKQGILEVKGKTKVISLTEFLAMAEVFYE